MDNAKRYEELKQRREKLNEKLHSLYGEQNVYYNRLLEMGFTSVEEAEEFLKKKEEENRIKEVEFSKKLEEFASKINEAEKCFATINIEKGL